MKLLARRRDPARMDWQVVHQVSAWCLGYPDEQLFDRLDLMRAALDEQSPSTATAALRRFLEHAATADRTGLAQHYTDVFDLSRKRTLYLSYWSAGDTRRRGAVLGRFKQLYRDSGFLVNLQGELPDHLPIVLEFTALADADRGTAILSDNRAALELIRFALLDLDSPYADILTAVCATLPGQAPPDRASAMAMAAPQRPVETVGLEPYDPRLLPLITDDPLTDPLRNNSAKAFR
ncbi:nitrate reductase molybdenum cofactor assembly chaperone [Gordonia neofelifaecis]|uniref:Nitrate reductase molybdenum cofactor assembly chaperone n=1 Tax=Gordonia neofelifaecis NRRL B-59395 TaxID=644548 RepID=F1YJA9_9ACTN|nr:nitrate reductase molybdenum cofactor assembly chaperone [Gordonia neofelifaecis]EGD55142.1 nitrate reductase molybdenum cofactor assembly chaperone [Gordonia neofelifaecis NRRL B-59395]